MDGLFPILILLLTAHVLEILSQLLTLPVQAGGPVEVIRDLQVFLFLLLPWVFRNSDNPDIVACPDKLTWGVRYVFRTFVAT